jgi:hypothetical protein
MIRALALLLSRAAQRALPPGREDWRAAMGAEMEHVQGNLAQLAFSASCVRAALNERVKHPPSIALAGIWAVALLTALLALFQLGCAARGASIALGAPDSYLEALLNGTEEQRSIGDAYRSATPAVVVCLGAMGLAQLLGAFLLARRKWRLFVLASWAALASCLGMAGIILWIGVGSEALLLQFSALVLQAIAVPLLWRILTPDPNSSLCRE